jgi:hypothetical protein
VFAPGVSDSNAAGGLNKEPKVGEEKSGIEMSSAARRLRNEADAGRFLRRRRFQTRNLWLLFLAFSTYLTRNASPGPMFAIIQIVNLRASSTPVNNKDQPGA